MVHFSKKPNNLYNINSFKHCENAKNVSVKLEIIKQNNPSSLVHKTVMKKEFSIMAKDVANQVRWASRFFSHCGDAGLQTTSSFQFGVQIIRSAWL
ncbi:hypothetical protein MKX03_021135 [Papaver bracteatum]|nr:hypothetical protein MKX03_021135 [Papaver bracteatum]